MRDRYTPEELERLHKELYEILGEIIRICKEHSIPYFAIGGTAIGALYDEAILPWDDDIDIGMKREDYDRFLQIAEKELKPEYFLSWQKTDRHSPYYFAKVKKNNTLFVEKIFRNVDMHQGIFVDIFPFDRIPDNERLQRMQHNMSKFMNCCLMGKETWMWKHCGKCEIEHPTDRGAAACCMNRMIDMVLPKRAIYALLRGVETMFNGRRTQRYNNVMTRTDRVTEESLAQLEERRFGPLRISVPKGLEEFLRYNYPKLHRFNEEEQAQVNNHYPDRLSFDAEKDGMDDHRCKAPQV